MEHTFYADQIREDFPGHMTAGEFHWLATSHGVPETLAVTWEAGTVGRIKTEEVILFLGLDHD